MRKVYFLLFFSFVLIATGAVGYVVMNNVEPVEDQTQIGLNRRDKDDKSPLPTSAIAALDIRTAAIPGEDSFYSCSVLVTASTPSLPWINSDKLVDLVKKPILAGSVDHDSEIEINTKGETQTATGNGLPTHTTGEFPATDPAEYVAGSTAISENTINLITPSTPVATDAPNCVPGDIVGVALSGAYIFGPLNAVAQDAVANEIFDSCEGHTNASGVYHYHHYSPCFEDSSTGHSSLVGYAIDGFGIYGPHDEDGNIVTNKDLDECHGHTGVTPTEDNIYHYHMNEEYPYVVGCLRAAPQ